MSVFYIHNGIDSGQFMEDESSHPLFFHTPTLSWCAAFVRFHQGKSRRGPTPVVCVPPANAERGLLNFGPSSRNGSLLPFLSSFYSFNIFLFLFCFALRFPFLAFSRGSVLFVVIACSPSFVLCVSAHRLFLVSNASGLRNGAAGKTWLFLDY